MRLGIISDIHVDVNKDFPIVKAIIEVCQNQKVDALIVAGDISNCYEKTMEVIAQLDMHLKAQIFFIPGNHDLWGSHLLKDTDSIYSAYANDSRCLCEKTTHLNKDWVIIGDIGWYDYSFGSHLYTNSQFDDMCLDNTFWQDKHHISWTANNVSKSREFIERLKKKLEKNQDKKIIFVTHMITHDYFSVPKEQTEWTYFRAFLGSRSLGQLAVDYSVKYNIMGHVHYRKELKSKGVHFICSCLNHHNQWSTENLEVEVNQALKIIDI